MIYRLALGQPNQEDFIDVLSRGGEATRALLQPLVLDFSAMGLRQQHMTAPDTLANGHGQITATGVPVLNHGDIVAPASATNPPITDIDAQQRLMRG
jgi:hypothetical protein